MPPPPPNLRVLTVADPYWLTRVQTGEWVWLTKESRFALVVERYYTAYRTISLQPVHLNNSDMSDVVVWRHIREDGTGLDFSQCLSPTSSPPSPAARCQVNGQCTLRLYHYGPCRVSNPIFEILPGDSVMHQDHLSNGQVNGQVNSYASQGLSPTSYELLARRYPNLSVQNGLGRVPRVWDPARASEQIRAPEDDRIFAALDSIAVSGAQVDDGAIRTSVWEKLLKED